MPRIFFILSAILTLSITDQVQAYSPARVALVQYSGNASFGNVSANTQALKALADLAVQNGAKIIVFPEGSTTGYEEAPHPDVTKQDRKRTWCAPGELTDLTMRFRKDVVCADPTPIAEAVPAGGVTQFWMKYAIDKQVYIVFDVLELVTPAPAVSFARTAVIVGPQGYVSHHRKTKRWQNEEYIGAVLGGPTVIETPYGRFGLAICSGVFANPIFDVYRTQGLSAVIFPSHWVPRDFDGFQGPSPNSFDFLAKWRAFDFLAADDSGSSRTGYYKADGSTVARVDRVGQTHVLFVDIKY